MSGYTLSQRTTNYAPLQVQQLFPFRVLKTKQQHTAVKIEISLGVPKQSINRISICHDKFAMSPFLNILPAVLLLHFVSAANYCGTSFGDADKCETSCPQGLDGECPGSERCFADVSCTGSGSSGSTSNYCGTSFGDADKCETSCPQGLDGECPGSERCYADVSCTDSDPPDPPTSSGFASAIVSTANDEYSSYGGRDECNDSGMQSRVGTYWDALGLNYDGCSDVPWSAAFVSYMVREAGGGSMFRYSSAHRVYIQDAFGGGQGLYNSVSDITTSTVRIGDLVCTGRARIESWTFTDFQDWYDRGADDQIPTHCDVVVAVDGTTFTVIGGNVSDQVTRKVVSKIEYAILLPVER